MKRILSMLLVVFMLFSMMPQAAFADEIVPVDSGISVNVGSNAVALVSGEAATAYYFEPAETGIYTVSTSAGTVGICGNFWVTSMPESASSSFEWTCTAVGQSIYIGVAGAESCVLTITKVEELIVETEPEA